MIGIVSSLRLAMRGGGEKPWNAVGASEPQSSRPPGRNDDLIWMGSIRSPQCDAALASIAGYYQSVPVGRAGVAEAGACERELPYLCALCGSVAKPVPSRFGELFLRQGRFHELGFYFGHDVFHGQTVLPAEFVLGGRVLDELIGPANPDDRGGDAFQAEQLQHGRAVPAHQDVVLDRDDEVGLVTVSFVRGRIQRFGKARVDDGDVVAIGCQLLRGLAGDGVHRSETEDGDFALVIIGEGLDDLRLADFEQFGFFLDGHALGGAARIADEDGVIEFCGGEHHVRQFIFVRGRHGNDVGQAAEVGDVEQAMMGGTVVGG